MKALLTSCSITLHHPALMAFPTQLYLANFGVLLACLLLAASIGSAFGIRRHYPVRVLSQGLNQNITYEFLAEQNGVRATVGVGPLAWSYKLADEASELARYQKDRKGCQFANVTSSNYGVNQATGSYPMSPQQAVALWAAQSKFYDHEKNKCVPPHDCSVYTQVVWRKSLEVGCAIANCAKGGSSLAICFYSPAGNVIGERPY